MFAKKIVLLGLLVIGLPTIADKMTYEEAMSKHRQSFGSQYNGRTALELDRLWSLNVQTPQSPVVSGGGKIETIWEGNSISVPLSTGPGKYYVSIKPTDTSKPATGAWVNVDKHGSTQVVGIPNPSDYQGYFWVKFENSAFKVGDDRWGKDFRYTGVYKAPSEEAAPECAPGATRNTPLNCPSNQNWNSCSEPGNQRSTCSAAGFWGPWTTTSQPYCIPQGSYCP
ncbi:hypothetical protein M2404_003888 [Rheinheimera pacifica]|uniref:hypothetical protein n=1 Tax=Rheinheimera pacifica TaxID=173990 RepID=UPI00216A6841|nr:hypothetical protein [Rheinheimera pacifica]MCS4309516.1 hypothetical protein [Rheinheimera pacifica]